MLLYSQYGPAAQGYMSDLVKTMITALSLPGKRPYQVTTQCECSLSDDFCSGGGMLGGCPISLVSTFTRSAQLHLCSAPSAAGPPDEVPPKLKAPLAELKQAQVQTLPLLLL
jgi:hypothetical protein